MRCLASLVALLVLLAAPARAEDREEAKKFFQIGTMNYDVGQYADALAAFEKARALAPLPGFLFNIAQCHRRMGNHGAAVRYFEQYLQESPAAKNRAEVEQLLVEERALAAAATPAADAAAVPAAAPAPAAEPLAPDAPSAAASTDDGNDALVWAAIGGGVLVVAAGAAVAIAMLPAPSPASLGRVDLRGAP